VEPEKEGETVDVGITDTEREDSDDALRLGEGDEEEDGVKVHPTPGHKPTISRVTISLEPGKSAAPKRNARKRRDVFTFSLHPHQG